MYEAVRNDPKIAVLTISEDGRGRKHVGRFLQKHALALPVAFDLDGGVQRAYGVEGIPTTVVIGPDGKVVDRHLGTMKFDAPEFVAKLRRWAGGEAQAASAPKGGL